MKNSWTYKQLTAAAERELRMLAAKAADPDPAEQSRRAAVAHGVFMLWHNATTQCNVMQDRVRFEALIKEIACHAPSNDDHTNFLEICRPDGDTYLLPFGPMSGGKQTLAIGAEVDGRHRQDDAPKVTATSEIVSTVFCEELGLIAVQRDASYSKAAIVHLDHEPSDEDLRLIEAALKRAHSPTN
ncbi:hypothetical protein RAS12_30755 (plasmid) [Achromobacter seleniivolatilans]|uniref:Phage protein n=1 Tax=Achromobacter seleniivolatilans TaxID=3047478 RepID=A0ABY9MBA7_9BURK|nr:hypothetical protein [Achromobacter sp. R39]WMD24015.1 hypothetical protein RAS12_30755 [Achromobacter sp. R39]